MVAIIYLRSHISPQGVPIYLRSSYILWEYPKGAPIIYITKKGRIFSPPFKFFVAISRDVVWAIYSPSFPSTAAAAKISLNLAPSFCWLLE